MFGSIWQRVRGACTRWRTGVDKANIEHLRVDLRFRLAMVEYAYFGRSGRRVSRCLLELKTVLGDKGVHRYLRTLDPDLRTQFVERFQGAQRHAGSEMDFPESGSGPAGEEPVTGNDRVRFSAPRLSSNVVPINHASRKSDPPAAGEFRAEPDPRSADSTD